MCKNYFKIHLLISMFITVIICDQKYFQINLKKSTTLSDKFISFNIDDKTLSFTKLPLHSVKFTKLFQTLSPAYIRIPLSQRFFHSNSSANFSDYNFNESNWNITYNWIRSNGFTPIFALPYHPNHWKPKNILKILGNAYKMNINNCIWQLGIDFNGTNAQKYSEDIQTLQLMINCFPETQWTVTTSEISFGSYSEEIRKFVDMAATNVIAIGWEEPTEFNSDEKLLAADEPLQNALDSSIPLWATMHSTLVNPKRIGDCEQNCVQSGLQLAKMFGYAGNAGFSAIFKTLNIPEIHFQSFNFIIMKLFKNIIGTRSFETNLRVGYAEKKRTYSYSYCSKIHPGSIVVFGINNDEQTHTFNPKFGKRLTFNQVHYYVLNVHDREIYLNNNLVMGNDSLVPIVKSRRGSGQISLTLPSFSIGFWELINGNVEECLNLENDSNEHNRVFKRISASHSSTNLFLKELIWNTVNGNTVKDYNNFNQAFNPQKPTSSLVSSKTVNQINVEEKSFDTSNGRKKRFILSPTFNTNELSRNGNHKLFNSFENKLSKTKLFRYKNENVLTKIAKRNRRDTQLVKDRPKPVKTFSEETIFQPNEHSSIPTGDIYLEVGSDGQETITDTDDVDYNTKKSEPSIRINKKALRNSFEDIADVSFNQAYVPNEYYEQYSEILRPITPKYHTTNTLELWEAIGPVPNYPYNQNQKNFINTDFNNDEQIGYVGRELEPTWRQNQEHLRRASETINSYYIDQPQNNLNYIINADQKNIGVEDDAVEQDDDSFHLKRDPEKEINSNLWRGKRSLPVKKSSNDDPQFQTQNKVVTAIETLVESLEESDKEISGLEIFFNQNPNKTVNFNVTNQIESEHKHLKHKRSLDFLKDKSQQLYAKLYSNYKRKILPLKQKVFGKYKRHTRSTKNLNSKSSWESGEDYNTIIKDFNHNTKSRNDDLIKPTNKLTISTEIVLPETHQRLNNSSISIGKTYIHNHLNKKLTTSEEQNAIKVNREEEEEGQTYYNYLQHFTKAVVGLMERSHKQLQGWWTIFTST